MNGLKDLKYIGPDGQNGLIYGKVYHVNVTTHSGCIWVIWDCGTKGISYKAIRSILEQWSDDV